MRLRILALLLLNGCGHNGTSQPVRIAVVHSSLAHMPAAFADELGFFKELGIQVSVESVPSTAKAMEALLAGSVDIVTTTSEQVLQLAAEDRDTRMFVLTTVRAAGHVIVSPGRKDIRSIRDLKGRSVGVAGLGSANHQFLNHVLVRHGLKPEDVSTAGIGTGRAAMAAVERGVVDAALVSSGEFFRLQTKLPGLLVLVDLSTPEGSKAILGSESYPTAVLAAQSVWLDRHPEDARRVARGILRTLAWLHEHPAREIRDRLPQAYLSDDPIGDIASLQAMQSIWSKDGIMPADGPETVFKALSLTSERFRHAKIDLKKTYTNELVREQ